MTQLEKYNLLKGISIFLVVCIHIVYSFFSVDLKPFSFEIFNYFTGFAVPFFYILGGFFFSKKFLSHDTKKKIKIDFIKEIKNMFERIIFPFYIFVVILTCYNFLMGKEIFWKHFLFIDSNEHGLYFLIIYTYAYIFSLIMLYMLNNISGRNVSIIMSIVSLLFFIFINAIDYMHSVVLTALPYISFFAFGSLSFFIITAIESFLYKLKSVFYLSGIVILFTIFIYVARKLFGPFRVFASAPPTLFYLIYCLLFFLIFLCVLSDVRIVRILKKFAFDKFGINSMFIFLIHPYLIKAIVPIIHSMYSLLGVGYKNSIFLGPVILVSYIITFISLKCFDLLPLKIRTIFIK